MKQRIQGMVIGMVAMAVIFGVLAYAGTIDAVYNNIKIVVDDVLIEPKDANGMAVEPFISGGTTYLPVRAVGAAFGKDVQWDGETNTVYLGNWTDKPYREVAVWNKPYLEVKDVRTSQEKGEDYINFGGDNSYIVYPTNGMAKEVKGTFIANGDAQYKFYDENNNLLYTSPMLTNSVGRYDFSFQVKNILQIKIETTVWGGWAAYSGRIQNLRFVSKDY